MDIRDLKGVIPAAIVVLLLLILAMCNVRQHTSDKACKALYGPGFELLYIHRTGYACVAPGTNQIHLLREK